MKEHPKILWDIFPQVAAWVEMTKIKSGWRIRDILRSLDIAPSTFYRVRRRKQISFKDDFILPQGRRNIYELLPEERMLIIDYALTYPNPRHRELAWKMVDEGVVSVSPSSVYRVLSEKGLVPKWKLPDEEEERRDIMRVKSPDGVWLTDLTYVWVKERWWYLIFLMDEYSRYIVYWELLWSMNRYAVSEAVERALAIPGRRQEPIIQSDNGPAFRSREFKRYLAHRGISHKRIYPHCPEQNGIIERGIRTIKELAGNEFSDIPSALEEMKRTVDYYNHERRHSALHYLRPIDYYRGNPEALLKERKRKMIEARERRKEINLGFKVS